MAAEPPSKGSLSLAVVGLPKGEKSLGKFMPSKRKVNGQLEMVPSYKLPSEVYQILALLGQNILRNSEHTLNIFF